MAALKLHLVLQRTTRDFAGGKALTPFELCDKHIYKLLLANRITKASMKSFKVITIANAMSTNIQNIEPDLISFFNKSLRLTSM
jgi:hypothetical protein